MVLYYTNITWMTQHVLLCYTIYINVMPY